MVTPEKRFSPETARGAQKIAHEKREFRREKQQPKLKDSGLWVEQRFWH